MNKTQKNGVPFSEFINNNLGKDVFTIHLYGSYCYWKRESILKCQEEFKFEIDCWDYVNMRCWLKGESRDE